MGNLSVQDNIALEQSIFEQLQNGVSRQQIFDHLQADFYDKKSLAGLIANTPTTEEHKKLQQYDKGIRLLNIVFSSIGIIAAILISYYTAHNITKRIIAVAVVIILVLISRYIMALKLKEIPKLNGTNMETNFVFFFCLLIPDGNSDYLFYGKIGMILLWMTLLLWLHKTQRPKLYKEPIKDTEKGFVFMQ
jgi:hypothetical protein